MPKPKKRRGGSGKDRGTMLGNKSPLAGFISMSTGKNQSLVVKQRMKDKKEGGGVVRASPTRRIESVIAGASQSANKKASPLFKSSHEKD